MELNAANIHLSQNLVDITSASSTINESNVIPSNETSTVSQQQVASAKKEGNLLSWFTSSSNTSAAAIINSPSTSIPPATSSSPHSDNEQTQDGSSSPNMKISSKLSYGEKFISKFNKNGNKSTSSDQQHAASGVSKEPQKSSRRTTSLLNLFMSNSQGKKITLKQA